MHKAVGLSARPAPAFALGLTGKFAAPTIEDPLVPFFIINGYPETRVQ